MSQKIDYTQASGLAGTRNYFINGGCQVAQRPAVTPNQSTQFGAVDRFFEINQYVVTAGSLTQGTGKTFSTTGNSVSLSGISAAQATAQYQIGQRIESLNVKHLKNKPFSASVKFSHNAGGNVTAQLIVATPSAADNWSSFSTAASGASVSVPANTPTTIKIENVSIDTSLGVSVTLVLTNTVAPSTTTYDACDWQMNDGSIVVAFAPNSFDSELQACQRYYEKSYRYDVAVASNTGLGGGIEYHPSNSNANAVETTGNVYFKATKRTDSWTGRYWDTVGNLSKVFMGSTNVALTGGAVFSYKADNGYIYDLVAGAAANRYAWHWDVDAEMY